MKLSEKGLKRLTMDIDAEIHADMKARAALRHTSITNYVLEAVAARILRENKMEEEKQAQGQPAHRG